MFNQAKTNFPQITLRDFAEIFKLNLQRHYHGDSAQTLGLLTIPGAGKSQAMARTLCPKLYAEFLSEQTGTKVTVDDICIIILRPAEKDAQEMSGPGIPYENDGVYTFRFTKAPLVTEIAERGRIIDGEWVPYQYGIVILEELADANDAEQNVCSSLCDHMEQTIGGDPIPSTGWIVMANGNRPGDRAGAKTINNKIVNRIKWFDLLFSITGWIEDFAIPEGICPVMIDFMEQYWQDIIEVTVPTVMGPFGSPRSVTNASYDLAAYLADPRFNGTVPQWLEAMFAANIGEKAAKLLRSFIEEQGEVAKPEEIFRDPANATVSAQVGFQLISASAAMSRVRNMDQAEATLEYIMRLRPDLQIGLGVKLQARLCSHDFPDSEVLGSPRWAEFDERFNKYLHIA